MTTSDDEPRYDEQPVTAETTHAEPYTDVDSVTTMAPPPARLPLAILASLGAMLVGVALWALLYVQLEREYVGVSVAIGIAVGWLMRVVSRRATLAVRIIAVLITAIGCVVGTVVAEVASTASLFNADFFQLLGDVAPETFSIVKSRPWLTFVIFALALVLAFMSAGEQKPKKDKKRDDDEVRPAADDEPPADPLMTAE